MATEDLRPKKKLGENIFGTSVQKAEGSKTVRPGDPNTTGAKVVLHGSTAQTLSARSHLEAATSTAWARRRRFINAIFFWQADHCKLAWEMEVERARYVLNILAGAK